MGVAVTVTGNTSSDRNKSIPASFFPAGTMMAASPASICLSCRSSVLLLSPVGRLIGI